MSRVSTIRKPKSPSLGRDAPFQLGFQRLPGLGRGADRAAIWNQTGWFQGADGKWRFEIPDDAMTVRFGEGMGVTGPQSKIQHNALAEAYPQMADTMHAIRKGDLRGSHWEANPEVGDRAIFWVWGPGAQEAKRATAHELQHAVQQSEGFASGGTPSQFESLLPSNVRATSARAQDAMHEAYRRLAGEVEARNVQARVDYSPEFRRAFLPWLTQDVPSNLQLVPGVESAAATELIAKVFESLAGRRGAIYR